MRRHEIGHDELLLARLAIDFLESVAERVVDGPRRLAHGSKHGVGHMLGGHAQLAGHVVLDQLAQKRAIGIGVGHDVVEANAGAHEHLLHAGQLPQLAQKTRVGAMIGLHRRAGLRAQAAAVCAGASRALLGASRPAEVGRGTSHIVDVALELGIGRHDAGLVEQRLVGAARDDAPLVESERAEGALAEAAATGGERELHLGKRRHAAGLVIGRMPRARIGQAIDGVHLILGQRRSRRVLHDIHAMGTGLHQATATHRIARAVLGGEALREGALVARNLFPAGQHLVVNHVFQRTGAKHRAIDEGEVAHGKARGEGIGNLDDRALPHAVGDEIGPGIKQDGALEGIGPVVVMGEPAQTRLDAAQNDGRFLEGAANEVRIDHGRVVGARAALAARRVGVVVAALLVHRVVVHHGVHVARRHEKSQPRLAEHRDAFRVVPIGLGDEAHLVAVGFQHPRDDGAPEGGMIHVGVAGDVDEVELPPAARIGLGPRGGQERRSRQGGTRVFRSALFRALGTAMRLGRGLLRHREYVLHRNGRGSPRPGVWLWRKADIGP